MAETNKNQVIVSLLIGLLFVATFGYVAYHTRQYLEEPGISCGRIMYIMSLTFGLFSGLYTIGVLASLLSFRKVLAGSEWLADKLVGIAAKICLFFKLNIIVSLLKQFCPWLIKTHLAKWVHFLFANKIGRFVMAMLWIAANVALLMTDWFLFALEVAALWPLVLVLFMLSTICSIFAFALALSELIPDRIIEGHAKKILVGMAVLLFPFCLILILSVAIYEALVRRFKNKAVQPVIAVHQV